MVGKIQHIGFGQCFALFLPHHFPLTAYSSVAPVAFLQTRLGHGSQALVLNVVQHSASTTIKLKTNITPFTLTLLPFWMKLSHTKLCLVRFNFFYLTLPASEAVSEGVCARPTCVTNQNRLLDISIIDHYNFVVNSS